MHRTGQVGTLKSHYWLLKAECSGSHAKLYPSREQLLSEVLQELAPSLVKSFCWEGSLGSGWEHVLWLSD